MGARGESWGGLRWTLALGNGDGHAGDFIANFIRTPQPANLHETPKP
tara:strand:- start:13535 stop:13675 length:141 start_codon:yes stop_codon:yes gene_type:complete